MEVLPSKHSQFTPVVLYLPGHEHERKRFHGEEPELWKVFRRLSQTRIPSKNKSLTQCEYSPPTLSIPEKDGIKCMCYENLMQFIKDRECIPPPVMYRSTNGRPSQRHFDSLSIFPSWTRKAIDGFRSNEQRQFPLGTLIVRWQLKRHLPLYDKNILRDLFTRFGSVSGVQILSPNSCLVIFETIEEACYAMQARHLGEPMNKLHCAWWHKSMANKNMIARVKGVSIRKDLFVV